MNATERRTLLGNVFFFSGLSSEELDTLSNLFGEEEFESQSVIFREGDPPENFYVVVRGAAAVWKGWGKDDAELLAVHGPGQLFGEMALVDDLPRSATVVTQDRTEVLRLDGKSFRLFIERNGNVALSVMRRLSSMVRHSNESFVEGLRARNRELERANTELKHAQMEILRSERLSSLGKMSSMILHDIRNPLSVLRSYGEMLESQAEDPERVRRCAHTIVREADRLNALANELLDYSRGEIRLNTKIVDGNELLKRVSELMEERLGARSIRLELNCELSAPLIADYERLLRVLTNLVDNARKAIPRGGTIAVSMWEADKLVHIRVHDTGRGMPPEVLEHVFEPFFSAESSGGTGLGMLIVKNVVEAHDGTIELSSTVGVGTTAEIRLPLRG